MLGLRCRTRNRRLSVGLRRRMAECRHRPPRRGGSAASTSPPTPRGGGARPRCPGHRSRATHRWWIPPVVMVSSSAPPARVSRSPAPWPGAGPGAPRRRAPGAALRPPHRGRRAPRRLGRARATAPGCGRGALARQSSLQRHLPAARGCGGLPCPPRAAGARRRAPPGHEPPGRLCLLPPPRLRAPRPASGRPGLGDVGHAARRLPLRATPAAPARADGAEGGGGSRSGRLPRERGCAPASRSGGAGAGLHPRHDFAPGRRSTGRWRRRRRSGSASRPPSGACGRFPPRPGGSMRGGAPPGSRSTCSSRCTALG